MAAVGARGFDSAACWRVNPQVAMRPEHFGGLLYHFGTRRLSFVKDRRLLRALQELSAHDSAVDACRAAGVELAEQPAFGAALARLAEVDMVVPGTATEATATEATATEATATEATATEGAVSPGGQAGEGVGQVSGPPAGAWEEAWASSGPPRILGGTLTEQFEAGLGAPICLTWELTYACNLACVHCLSSSGRRDPAELSTAQAEAVIDQLQAMQVFYVNIGGGEPSIRGDFWELVDYATDHRVGVKFSTHGSRITPSVARRLAASDYVDVQLSLDGATPEVNDAVRGEGSYVLARTAMERLCEAGFAGFKLSVVVTRYNLDQLDQLKAMADAYGAQLRITRLRPSGRGAKVWDDLHPRPDQQRRLYDWLMSQGEEVLTGDSFFHLGGYGVAPPGLNLCGAGRVVCLIDPVGDVYACPFAIHSRFRAGNVADPGGFEGLWRRSELFAELRSPKGGGACSSCGQFDACRGGCMAAKFFTGLPLDAADPECVKGHGAEALLSAEEGISPPAPEIDHSRPLRGFGTPPAASPGPPAASPGTSVPVAITSRRDRRLA